MSDDEHDDNNDNDGLLYSADVCHSVTLLALIPLITPALAPLPLRRSSITRNNFLPGNDEDDE